MDEVTILYTTDSVLNEKIAAYCRKEILTASCGKRIVSVSQAPLDFGDNICVGEIGRSALSIERQILVGIKNISTRWVAIAEHDVIYYREHFNFVPPDDRVFWYNKNFYVLKTDVCRYSVRARKIYSQLVCSVELLKEATTEKIKILCDRWEDPRRPVGEPGAVDYFKTMRRCGSDLVHEYCIKYASHFFYTKIPNIDIKHGDNFTGSKQGKHRTETIRHYGSARKLVEKLT